jgi:hypothetical protein
MTNELIHVGIAGALAEISRRNLPYLQAEARLVEKMKPAKPTLLDLSNERGEWPALPFSISPLNRPT